MTYLEKSWTAVCFQFECTDEQREKLETLLKPPSAPR
jgi:hypothetical protein